MKRTGEACSYSTAAFYAQQLVCFSHCWGWLRFDARAATEALGLLAPEVALYSASTFFVCVSRDREW